MDLVPFLNIAVTCAVFQSAGILPISKDLLYSTLRGSPRVWQSSTSTLGGILSGPWALSLFNLPSFSVTAAGVTLISDKVIPWELPPSCRNGTLSSIFSRVKTLAKNALRVFAFSSLVTVLAYVVVRSRFYESSQAMPTYRSYFD